jgi:hypothetical protein
MSSPQASKAVMKKRAQLCDGGEPLHDDERSVLSMDGTLYINPTKFGENMHSLSAGDDVVVEVYDEGIWIGTGETDE